MRKLEKSGLLFVLAVTVITVVFFGSCSGAGSPSQFYGVWQNKRENGMLKVELTEKSWSGKIEESSSYYVIDNLSWSSAVNDAPITKENYPKGYYITGTVSSVKNIRNLIVGQQQTYAIFMNKDKTAFLRKSKDSSDFIFTKAE